MKYKVIGWTNALNKEIEECDYSIATYNVIFDDIVKNGYRFTGCTHQNHDLGVPVLNDGKKRTLSEREWGMLMSSIHKDNDYVTYAYADFDGVIDEILPPLELQITNKVLTIDENINEELIIEVDETTFKLAKDKHLIHQFKSQENRYLEVGDKISLLYKEQKSSYLVRDCREGYNTGENGEIKPEYYEDLWKEYIKSNGEKKAQISQIFAKDTDVLTIYLD
jgi:hypothetical protein